jgi:hypothetical protein
MDTQHPHHDFAMAWDKYMDIAAVVFVGLAVLTFLYYEFRLLQVKDYKEKYDFVNRNEIMYFWYSVILLILSAFFLSQGFSTEKIMDIGMILVLCAHVPECEFYHHRLLHFQYDCEDLLPQVG